MTDATSDAPVMTTRVAVVTGASEGIGRAGAARLAEDGSLVAAIRRAAKDDVDAVAALMDGRGCAYRVDIVAPASVRDLFSAVGRTLGFRRCS